MNQLTIIEKMTPAEAFSPGTIDSILKKIASESRAVSLDISTEKERKEVASLAFKIARSKTFIDDLGKKLGEDFEVKLNAIRAERKKARDFLDNLKDEIRAPLDNWENAEKKRIADHEAAILKIIELGKSAVTSWQNLTVEYFVERLSEIDSLDRNWQEFETKASREIEVTKADVKGAIENLQKRTAEREELERFRAAEAKRIQSEREATIAREAGAKAKAEAETKAKAKIQAAKLDKEEAEKKAKAAVEKERLRVAQEIQAEQEAAEKREANTRHKAKINREILAAIEEKVAVEEKVAKEIISVIAKGEIPHVKISY